MIIHEPDVSKRPVSHQTELVKNVILAKGIVPGLLQCATACFKAGDVIEPHVHESMTEIFYVIEGTACLEIESQKHSVYQGDTFVVSSGSVHGIEFISKTKLFYFSLDCMHFNSRV